MRHGRRPEGSDQTASGRQPPGPCDLGVKGDDMPYYRVAGEIPGKRHVRFRRPDGGLYAEELMGEEGFGSDSSLLYHVHPPTAIVKSEGVEDAAECGIVPNHPLLPRHFRTQELPGGGDLVLGRRALLANDDI